MFWVSFLCFSFNCTWSRQRKHCSPLVVDHKVIGLVQTYNLCSFDMLFRLQLQSNIVRPCEFCCNFILLLIYVLGSNCTWSRLRKHCCPLAVDHKKSVAWDRHYIFSNFPFYLAVTNQNCQTRWVSCNLNLLLIYELGLNCTWSRLRKQCCPLAVDQNSQWLGSYILSFLIFHDV